MLRYILDDIAFIWNQQPYTTSEWFKEKLKKPGDKPKR